MKSTNRKRALIISAAVILLCMTVIVGMSWALFTDTKSVSNHLQAGDLTITLERTELVKRTLNASGYLVDSEPDKSVVDFTNNPNENVFGLTTDGEGNVTEKIVPGSKFTATMQIENHSDVAFGYWIEIVCKDKTQGEDLAKQLKVTVTTDADASRFVGDGLVVKGAGDGFIEQLAIGETGTFTVTVEFLDSFIEENGLGYYDNDKAQNEELKFDLVVHAVQATTAPTTP